MAEFTEDQRSKLTRQGKAMAGGRYPIRNRDDLENAIQAVGRAKGGSAGRQAVRRWIIKRAKELGLVSLVPDTWNSDGTLTTG